MKKPETRIPRPDVEWFTDKPEPFAHVYYRGKIFLIDKDHPNNDWRLTVPGKEGILATHPVAENLVDWLRGI